jgi:hypothetical protein
VHNFIFIISDFGLITPDQLSSRQQAAAAALQQTTSSNRREGRTQATAAAGRGDGSGGDSDVFALVKLIRRQWYRGITAPCIVIY